MRKSNKLARTKQTRRQGFSTLELLIVMMISLIIAALAIPGFDQMRRALRISGDVRDLNGAINQAKLQAAAGFTDARVFVDLGFNIPNSFHIDVWNKAGLGGAGCWQVVGDVNNPCYTPGVSPVQRLSPSVTFGFAGVGAPPPNTQTQGISQAPGCVQFNGRRVGLVGRVPTTACIHFNSRGIPVNAATGAPYSDDAVYITDNTQVYAVTVSPTGMSQVWATGANNSTAAWYHK